jgi:segregation and condensation protein A
MDYEIQLDVFQGPLDLLLHLIEENEIDIYNIPIALITDQYLGYIHTIQLLNLEMVGDFLVMAATLMQIKAKMLLPQTSVSEDENPEDEDPRLELAHKLIEYKKIKEASISLQALEVQQLKIYTRTGGEFADLKVVPDTDPLKNLSIWDLMDAFKAVLDSLDIKPIAAVPKEEISIRQRMTEIFDLLIQEKTIFFKAVFQNLKTKIALITCFLAVLELIRLHKISACQDEVFGEIALILIEESAGNEQ